MSRLQFRCLDPIGCRRRARFGQGHTLGEYGSENAWIRRAWTAGGALLPKWQLESPLTPVTGPRLTLAKALLKSMLTSVGSGRLNALTLARLQPDELRIARQHRAGFAASRISSWESQCFRQTRETPEGVIS